MTHAGPSRGWFPASPCDARCRPGTTAARGRLRRVAALLGVGAAVVASDPLLPLVAPRHRANWVRATTRALLTAAGVRVEVAGPPSFGSGGVLVVANHVSWIEVLALASVQPLRLVAKHEVRAWPVVGRAAEAAGTVFFRRSRLRTLPADVDRIGRALAADCAVAAFPEGTTWCGAAAGTFRPAIFQAAVDAAAPVRPVAVTLCADGRHTAAASFVGDEGLLGCLYRVAGLPGVVCRLTVLPALPPGDDRAGLARRAAAAIGAVTGVPHPDRRSPDGRGGASARPARAA